MILLHYRVAPGVDLARPVSEPEPNAALTAPEQHDCDCDQATGRPTATVTAA